MPYPKITGITIANGAIQASFTSDEPLAIRAGSLLIIEGQTPVEILSITTDGTKKCNLTEVWPYSSVSNGIGKLIPMDSSLFTAVKELITLIGTSNTSHTTLLTSLATLATTPATETVPITDAAGTVHQVAGFVGNWHTGNFDPASKQDADDAKLHAMTQAEFMAGIERNNNLYACSGSVEYGKHLNSAAPINEGLWERVIDANMLRLGAGYSNTGTSRTNGSIVNVNGVIHSIDSVVNNEAGFNNILFPDAPDGKKTYDSATGTVTEHLTAALAFAAETATNKVITSRKDFVMIESWPEKISDKDWVMPLGNVQYMATSYKGIDLGSWQWATDAGYITYAEGYQKFGDWQADDTMNYARGFPWSLLTPAQQKIFLADPENNIYLSDEGDLIQVRYRVRVIEGLGDEWDDINPLSNNTLRYNSSSIIKCQGRNLTPFAANYSWDVETYYGGNEGTFGEGVVGAWNTRESTSAHNGLCFAIPICLVQRLNSGAYHPFFNEYGCAFIGKLTDGSGRDSWHSSTVKKILSQAEAFTEITVQANGQGKIADGASGHKAGKFYDAICASQVTDLRLQAREPTPTQLEPNYWMDRAVAGDHKNYVMEGAPRLVVKERGVVETLGSDSAGNALTVTNSADYVVGDFVMFINQNSAHVWSGYVAKSSANLLRLASTFTEAINLTWGVSNGRTLGDIYTILKVEYSKATTQEITWTDIIGDPRNYPRQATGVIDWTSDQGSKTLSTGQTVEVISGNTGGALVGNIVMYINAATQTIDLGLVSTTPSYWLDLGPKAQFLANATGMEGFPLLFGENGEDLIPDGTSKYFKLSRKCTESFGVAWSGDAGVSWTKHTAWNAAMESSANGRTEAELAGNVYLLPYKTPAHVFTDDVNSEVGGSKLGDVYAMDNADGDGAGAKLSSELIGKVATGTGGMASTAQYTVLSKRIDFRTGKLYTAPVTHPTINLDGTGPAAKALPYISRDNAQGKLLLVSKEMIYDTTRDSLAEVDVVSNTGTTATWTTNQLVHFARDDAGVLSRQILRAVDNGSGFSSSALQNFYMDAQGNFIWSNGTAYFKKVDLGWGDNNEFIVGDNTTTFTDENGNTGLASTKSTVLPIIIRK